MALRKNKIFIFLVDIVTGFLFFIPILLYKICARVHLSYPKKILIIELWGIGDLVMMSSVLEPLRYSFPQSKITLLSKTSGSVLLDNSSYIDEFIEFDFPWTRFRGKYKLWIWDWKGLIKIIKKLRKERFDLILDARGDIRNNLLSFLINAKKRVGYSWTGGEYFLTDIAPLDFEKKHRVDAWINLLNYLRIKTESARPFLKISEDKERWVKDFLRNNDIKVEDLLVGIHPGARIKKRCWAIDRFARVSEYIRDEHKAKIIVFIEPDDYGNNIPIRGEYIKAKVSLRELVALIKELDLLVCNDSGIMHIATAVGTPVVTIFGPGDVKKIGPYWGGNIIVMKEDIKCSPCYDYCKYDTPLCLDGIKAEDVIQAMDHMIETVLAPSSQKKL